jgi:hypothetical protein
MLKPGDLVMPNDQYLQHIHPCPRELTPGVLIERVSPPGPHLPGANRSWRVLWRDERHVMFENEFVPVGASNV